MHTYLQQFHLLQEPSRYADQRLFGPLMEPIDTRAICDRRKLPSTHAQSGTDGREAEDDLQCATDAVDEEFPAVFARVLQAHACVRRRGQRI